MLRITLLAASLATAGLAQDPAADEDRVGMLRERRAEVLAHPVFHDNPWTTDLAAARRAAAQRGQPILAYFTRSYKP